MDHRRRERFLAAGSIVVFLSLSSASVAASGEIRRNPFVRPPTEVLLEERPAVADRQRQEWRPELRAVLVAGKKSVADFGGVILKVGEITNGYRLLSVHEDAATFSRDGEKIVFSLFEQELSDQQ